MSIGAVCLWLASSALLPPSYTVSGAGNASVDGVYEQSSTGSYVSSSSSGLQLFQWRGTWYLGKTGTGPVLYAGACASATPPSNWTTYTWHGAAAPPPVPRLAASGGAPLPAACATSDCAYTLRAAGTAAANGCYAQEGPSSFVRVGGNGTAATAAAGAAGAGAAGAGAAATALRLYRRAGGEWVVGVAGSGAGVAPLYQSTCNTSSLPPVGGGGGGLSGGGWGSAADGGASGSAPPPAFSSSARFPLGYCAPTPAPPPKPHPSCATPQCVALWGPAGCPDLNPVAPDLVRPPMLSGDDDVLAVPAAGARVRAVAPGFEGTQAYHALYLPSEWIAAAAAATAAAATASPGGGASNTASNKADASNTDANADADAAATTTYPVIVEYMGNGPYNDGYGDLSSGRPEDSNLGWGMAEPAGSKYIWISMPHLSADLGADTQVSTYWWGCPSSSAQQPCAAEFDVAPTIRYLHAALNDTFARFGGDPARVVIAGWSRGAIATGAIGLHDDATSKLFKAFVPYSHLDGDCGWVDGGDAAALARRWARLAGRPMLYLGECAVATEGGPAWVRKIGMNGSQAVAGMEFMTTGWANHNDAWVLRNSSARTYLRQWLARVLQ